MRHLTLLIATAALLCHGSLALADAGGLDSGVLDASAVPDGAAGAQDPQYPDEVADDFAGALDSAKGAVEQLRAKQWFAFSVTVIWLLMFLFKTARKSFDFMKGIPKRVLWILVPLLSIAAMILAKLQADLSWGAAVEVLLSGPVAAFANDLVKRGILDRDPSPMGPV